MGIWHSCIPCYKVFRGVLNQECQDDDQLQVDARVLLHIILKRLISWSKTSFKYVSRGCVFRRVTNSSIGQSWSFHQQSPVGNSVLYLHLFLPQEKTQSLQYTYLQRIFRDSHRVHNQHTAYSNNVFHTFSPNFPLLFLNEVNIQEN